MGLDAMIYLDGTNLSDETVAEIQSRLPEFGKTEVEGSVLRRYDGMVVIYTWHRYYGDDYRRGNWPHIRMMIEALAEASGLPVYYTSDMMAHVYEDYLVTPERLAELDAIWERHGADYGVTV